MIIDILKLNVETNSGIIFTEEDAKLIIDIVNSKPYYSFGELNPENISDISLGKVSHTISGLYIEDNRLWGNFEIFGKTFFGETLNKILSVNNILNKLVAINRQNQIDSVMCDNLEYERVYPSDLFREKGLYFSLRGAQSNGKLRKFFTFDIRSDDKNQIFVDKNK